MGGGYDDNETNETKVDRWTAEGTGTCPVGRQAPAGASNRLRRASPVFSEDFCGFARNPGLTRLVLTTSVMASPFW
jgi:hypothetical protein